MKEKDKEYCWGFRDFRDMHHLCKKPLHLVVRHGRRTPLQCLNKEGSCFLCVESFLERFEAFLDHHA